MFSLGTYDWKKLGSTDEAVYGKFEVLFICASPGYLYGLEFGYNEVTELRLHNGRDL